MSNEGDRLAFEQSINDNVPENTTVLFNEKKWTYIVDSTSNSGVFNNQVQFDLQTLSSQSQWIDLKDAVIQLPIKTTIQLTQIAVTDDTTSLCRQLSTVIKNGWHQYIDSVQLQLGDQTIVSNQIYQNVETQFRILSEWSQDDLIKYGPSCGFALDDMSKDSSISTEFSLETGLSNAPSSVADSVRGFDCLNKQITLYNQGVINRSILTNNILDNGSFQVSILGASSMKQEGRGNCCSTAASNVLNTYLYSANYLATIRLRDLIDLSELPLCKNIRGTLFLNFNSCDTILTGSTTTDDSLASVSYNIISGRTNPILVNIATTGASGIRIGKGTTPPKLTVRTGVDGSSIGNVETSAPLLTNARLLVPWYKANPKIDERLTMCYHQFYTTDKIVQVITVPPAQSINQTITSGVSNPHRLIILPLWQNLGGANLPNPELSCFDTVPASSGPFASLMNYQVYCANQALYQYPQNFTYEQYLEEIQSLGANGDQVQGQTSGLLSEILYTQNHAFITTDLSRRIKADDGVSRSVQVSFTNPSSTYGLKCIVILQYKKTFNINTASGMISPA